MNNPFRLAIDTAALFAVVAIVGSPRSWRLVGGPWTRSDPDCGPVADSVAVRELRCSFAPQDDLHDRLPMPCSLSRMAFTVPATGWSAFDPVFVGKNLAGGGDTFDLYLSPFLVANTYTGGCHWLGTALTPPVGPTVDDLATALIAQAGPGASPPVAVTMDGHPGKKVELSIPKDLDVATCDSDGEIAIGIARRDIESFGIDNSTFLPG